MNYSCLFRILLFAIENLLNISVYYGDSTMEINMYVWAQKFFLYSDRYTKKIGNLLSSIK